MAAASLVNNSGTRATNLNTPAQRCSQGILPPELNGLNLSVGLQVP